MDLSNTPRVPTTDNYVDGLYVKNGRLINSRPDGMMGIEQAAKVKKAMKRGSKIEMMADAIDLADSRKKFRGLL